MSNRPIFAKFCPECLEASINYIYAYRELHAHLKGYEDKNDIFERVNYKCSDCKYEWEVDLRKPEDDTAGCSCPN